MKIKKSPDKYIKEMEAKGIVLEAAPKDKAAVEKKDESTKMEKK